jgi:TonB family protein
MASRTTLYPGRWTAAEDFSRRRTATEPEVAAGDQSILNNPTLDPSSSLFALLPDQRPRTGAFGLGLLITSSILAIGCMVPLVVRPAAVESATKYLVIELTAPQIAPPDVPALMAKATPAPVPKLPAIEVPRSPAKIQAEVVPVASAIPSWAPQLPQPRFVAPAHVQTNVFVSTGSSAPATTTVPRNKLQTGGFGDPNGAAPAARDTGKNQVAIIGGFDLPPGSGQGNGTAGARGRPGMVSSAGFGNGIATSSASVASHGQVQQAGFGGASGPASAQLRAQPAAAKLEPVEILSKPSPVYSDEARKRRVEGDVLVEVIFLATGEVQVVRVLSGLEQDLDSAAVQAARQIKFKPARRDGQPYDLTATVRIAFRLAY